MTQGVSNTLVINSIRDVSATDSKTQMRGPIMPLSLPLLLPSPALLLFRRSGFIAKNEGARVFVCSSFSRTQRRTGKYDLTDSAEERGSGTVAVIGGTIRRSHLLSTGPKSLPGPCTLNTLWGGSQRPLYCTRERRSGVRKIPWARGEGEPVVPSRRAQVPEQRKESVCKMTRLFDLNKGEDIPSETFHIGNEANGRIYE